MTIVIKKVALRTIRVCRYENGKVVPQGTARTMREARDLGAKAVFDSLKARFEVEIAIMKLLSCQVAE